MLKFASSSQNIEKKIILSKKRGEITRFDGTNQQLMIFVYIISFKGGTVILNCLFSLFFREIQPQGNNAR